MLEILGYLLLIGLGIMLIKLFFSFLVAAFPYTTAGLICSWLFVIIISGLDIVSYETAGLIVYGAIGICFFVELLRFIMSPGKKLPETKEIFDKPWNSGSSSSTRRASEEEPDGRDKTELYMKSCGSCKWFSNNSSHYSVCTLFGGEKDSRDSCSDWQRG